MSDKLCHCNNPRVVANSGSAEDPFKLEYAEDRVVESSAGSNHSDQVSTNYFEPMTGVEVQLRQVSKSPDPNAMVPDQTECACHPAPVPVASNDIPMAEEIVMRVVPQEVHGQSVHEVGNILSSLDTPVDIPPSYAVSGQCYVHTKGHISSPCPKPYQQSNYFLGQCLGLQSTIDLHHNWLCAKRTGFHSYSARSVSYSGDVDHSNVDSNRTFDEWDMDQSVDLGIGLGDYGDV